jgi:hypothetical protein
MERVREEGGLGLLRAANQHFSEFFLQFAGTPVTGSDREVDALRRLERVLRSVGELLNRGLQKSCDSEVHDALLQYRENLLRLRRELGMMQDSAMACRGRLFVRQRHLDAAQAWCAAARDTR